MTLSTPTPPTPVAGPPATPYTASMAGERVPAPVPWWKEAVRSWVPILGLAALLVFHMVSLQQQIGDLGTDVQREIGSLRTDLHQEIDDLGNDLRAEIGDLRNDLRTEIGDLRNDLRTEIGDLRDGLRTEIGDLRVELGERIARVETLMEAGSEAPRPVR